MEIMSHIGHVPGQGSSSVSVCRRWGENSGEKQLRVDLASFYPGDGAERPWDLYSSCTWSSAVQSSLCYLICSRCSYEKVSEKTGCDIY